MHSIGKRIAIIGAGPIGLEAGLHGALAGFDVRVYECGCVAQNVREWGHVRLFSPFGMNSSVAGRRAVEAASGNVALPNEDDHLTGREFADRYLVPLSRVAELAGRIHERVEVLSLGRSRHWKGDAIGDAARLADPFQLLVRHADGSESVQAADFVLDCSGTYPNHNWIGAGGMPCLGERAVATRISYLLPDLLGVDRDDYLGRRTLVVGSGFSAATAVVSLAQLAAADPRMQVIWVTRRETSPPMARIANDALAARDQLAADANRLALSADGPVCFLPGCVVRGMQPIERPAGTGVCVLLEQREGTTERAVVDRVIANVGYRPNRGLYEELQVHECYASQGPIKLAAALLGETSSDCLAQTAHGAATLRHPEPGFLILGSKSYGRDSRFLIRVGLQQVADVFKLIGDNNPC